MKQFILLFKKVDGKNILLQYARAHVLFFAFIQTLLQGFSKKSLEIVRLSMDNKIISKLRKNYKAYIDDYLQQNAQKNRELPRVQSKKVWVCWLQGIENAPKIVRQCYKSLKCNLADREIILLTEDNYREYVSFPDFIQDKIDSGVISRTHMSDLLRLELLIKYGGTWIDATVFCSGKNIPKYMLDSDLFLFQCLKPGLDGHASAISSWYMTACTNNPILLLSRSLLYEYWTNKKTMIDYFLLHDFFQLALEAYPEEWQRVIPRDNAAPHILLLRLFETYDDGVWEAVKQQTCFHKLSYKFDKSETRRKNTYYDVILRGLR